MDFHLKQWRNQQQEQEQEQEHEQQHESEEQQHSAKMPKLDLQNSDPSSGYALPLFVPEPNTNNNSKMMSPFSESSSSTSAAPTRFPKMGSYFSVSQWQELELQALIFRYMLAGAAVPPELLQPIKKSLLLSHHPPSPYFFHHPLQHFPQFQPHALLQTGYWGRGAMDPEPTRCRRTDGKKWRCSRDVVAGQKYCERHVHRGRNRSRKPVENTTTAMPTTTAAAAAGGGAEGGFALNNASTNTTTHTSSGGTHFALSGSSFSSSPSNDLLHLNHSEVSGSAKKSDSHILRPFFDDWPGKLQEPDNARSNAGSMNSATSLSISIRGNASSDVSLKLSTGNVESGGHQEGHANHGVQPQLNWPPGWATNQMASMGGPLAEALRSSSNSNSSPTSVLHQLPRSSLSETSFITT